MITNDELNISNVSYTKKDFQSVYEEVLDLCTKISNRIDFGATNESDPGVVLLKLAAFIADKNNYNIDKNVLEAFLPSATQETSVRELCARNGYDMKYYQSAKTKVKLVFKDPLGPTENVKLPKYSTVVSDVDGNVKYTLLKDVEFWNLRTELLYTINDNTVEVEAIEGTVETLMVGDSEIFTIDNIDDNRRIYFPVKNVAENGIFIESVSDGKSTPTTWIRVLNLNTRSTEEPCFKFGFDSKRNLPYVEFSSSIAQTIGQGIKIKYTLSTGVNGNVSANSLTTLASYGSSDTDVFSKDDVLITNLSSTSTGANPESIDEAYNNFKKTVGTFDNLVTCRDYAKYIYNLLNEDTENNYVSNVIVADRRDDINYSKNTITYDAWGVHSKGLTTFNDITPFELCIYPFPPILTEYNIDTFKKSFTPMRVADQTPLIQSLENSKETTISHDYKDYSSNDNLIYCYKNYMTLNCKISTTYKVNPTEESKILANIKNALCVAFNSRKVDFGEEIPYDSILNVIQNADDRIQNVILDEPKLKSYAVDKDGNDYDILKANGSGVRPYYIDMIAKNVVNGKLPYYEFDNSFKYNFGQNIKKFKVNGSEVDKFQLTNLSSVETETEIELSTTDKELKSNERVVFLSNSYSSEVSYQVGIYYTYESTDPEQQTIPAGVYTLKSTDTLKFYNRFGDLTPITGAEYGVGTTIQTSFDIQVTSTKESIGSGDKIDIVKPVTYKLEENIPCYWTMSNITNTLFGTGQSEVILKDGEYFIYSDPKFNSLIILGSGNKLTLETPATAGEWVWNRNVDLISPDSVINYGLSAFEGFKWEWKNFGDVGKSMTVTEMKVVSCSGGDKIKLESGTVTLSNTEVNNITGIIINDDEPLENMFDENGWTGYSVLDINSVQGKGQSLYEIL